MIQLFIIPVSWVRSDRRVAAPVIMSGMRKEFRVATKVALFSPDRSKVLVIHMDQNNDWGLPGGHIEESETPDETIVRELREECGTTSEDMQHADFFLHSSGKLILAYIGTAISDDIASQQGGLEGTPKWLTREEFDNITIEPNYRKLILENW